MVQSNQRELKVIEAVKYLLSPRRAKLSHSESRTLSNTTGNRDEGSTVRKSRTVWSTVMIKL
jgi:hypothetical protein